MFNIFKKNNAEKKEMGKITISKIESVKYKSLLRKIIGNRGNTIYKFVDEYNRRDLKVLDPEIRSAVLKYFSYGTNEEFELALYNMCFSDIVVMYLEIKKYILLIDWKGEDEEDQLLNYVVQRFQYLENKTPEFGWLKRLEQRIKENEVCLYSSDFLLIKAKLIDEELKTSGYSLYTINNNSDTYHFFIAKTGSIGEDEKIINFWASDIDDYQYNGIGKVISAGISEENIRVSTEKGAPAEIKKNTFFFINNKSDSWIEIETINCDHVIKGKIPRSSGYEIIC